MFGARCLTKTRVTCDSHTERLVHTPAPLGQLNRYNDRYVYTSAWPFAAAYLLSSSLFFSFQPRGASKLCFVSHRTETTRESVKRVDECEYKLYEYCVQIDPHCHNEPSLSHGQKPTRLNNTEPKPAAESETLLKN